MVASSSSTKVRIMLWSWLRSVFVSGPSPFERRRPGKSYKDQPLSTLPRRLLTRIFETKPVNSSREVIMLCIQKSLKLDHQLLKAGTITRQARTLSVGCPMASEVVYFTLRPACMSIPVRRCSRSPVAVVKDYRSRLGRIHTDPPTRSGTRPCPGLRRFFEHP